MWFQIVFIPKYSTLSNIRDSEISKNGDNKNVVNCNTCFSKIHYKKRSNPIAGSNDRRFLTIVFTIAPDGTFSKYD